MPAYFHKSPADLAIGDMVLPGNVIGKCNHPRLFAMDPTRSDYVWMTRFSQSAAETGGKIKRGTLYRVAPVGPIERAGWRFDYTDRFDRIATSAIVMAIIQEER